MFNTSSCGQQQHLVLAIHLLAQLDEESVEDGRVCRHLAVLVVDGEAGVGGGRGNVPELRDHDRPVVMIT